jgi:riboflavin transporter FmnP
MSNVSMSTRKLCTLGLLGAISVVLVAFIHFPIFPLAPFLEYDPADIPIFVGTLFYGPVAGLFLTVIVSVVQGLTVSAASGVIGIFMHLVATGSFVLVFGLLTRKNKSIKRSVIALILGILTWTSAMVLWNLLLTPVFMGTPVEAVLELMLPAILPFNLIKAGVNGIVALLVAKSVRAIVKREL